MAAFIGPATSVLDFAGKTIVPGFIDAHLHPQPHLRRGFALGRRDCRPEKVRNFDELIAALKRKADKTPAGQWVIGSRYQETKLGRHPTRFDLDRASTNHPILISHSSGHQSVCNSLALKLAKVTRDTPDPAGGKFVRAADGELTGLLAGTRRGHRALRRPERRPQPPEAETSPAIASVSANTSAGVSPAWAWRAAAPALAKQLENARAEDLPLRFYMMLDPSYLDAAVQRKAANHPEDGVRFGAIKTLPWRLAIGADLLADPALRRTPRLLRRAARAFTGRTRQADSVHSRSRLAGGRPRQWRPGD